MFWKRIFTTRNRCENSFYFFVFSAYASDKHTFDDGKNWKSHIFLHFWSFFFTLKMLPGHLCSRVVAHIWASRCPHENPRKVKNHKNCFFKTYNARVTQMLRFFSFFPKFFLILMRAPSLRSQSPWGCPCLFLSIWISTSHCACF